MPATLEQIARFAARHTRPGVIVLPNAWDPGSAALMAEAGFEAIATTSAGIAHAQGLPDGALGRDEMLEHAARIARAVPVPVTADLEDGYGARAEDVALTVAAAVEAGPAGGNIGDSGVGGDPALINTERACDRLRAARQAIPHGCPFVLNARTDPYLVRRDAAAAEENFAEAVRRARAYAAAGADCVFVAGPGGAATVGWLAAAIAAPLNVVGARAGREAALTVADLARLGVRRVSIGGSLALAAMGFAREALAGMARGAFAFGRGAPTNAEMDRLMARLAPAEPAALPPDRARARQCGQGEGRRAHVPGPPGDRRCSGRRSIAASRATSAGRKAGAARR